MRKTVAFDADDTLWHNEALFFDTHERFRQLLEPYGPSGDAERLLLETERRNLKLFGYGVKGFTLSMIETAVELTQARIEARDVHRIIEFGKSMIRQPVELLDGVEETLDHLDGRYRLMVITKGDLFHQETKIARSRLSEKFEAIEIVSEKNLEAYKKILASYAIPADQFVMVGNSMRSDILPVIDLGARAVFIPNQTTWVHEQAPPPANAAGRYREAVSVREVPQLLRSMHF